MTTVASSLDSTREFAFESADFLKVQQMLFKKAGIVYCSSREELLSVASIFTYKKLEGKNIAIITHAGGSAVMLTDVLSKGGLNIPSISGKAAKELETYLFPGSSVGNPIDFLATGTAEQLGIIIDYCEHKFDHIDAMVVVFGSPGLFDVENVYNVLSVKLDICKKAIFPVLPSVINAEKEIKYFLSKGHVNFPDEVVLGKALCEAYFTGNPVQAEPRDTTRDTNIDIDTIRSVLETPTDENGYLSVTNNNLLMDTIGIPRAIELTATDHQAVTQAATKLGYPVVMKVVGPLHKSDVGGVALDINSDELVTAHFNNMMAIEGAEGVLLQKQYQGTELFIGISREAGFGHLLLMGLGGIFVEVIQDIKVCLCPCTRQEIQYRLKNLKSYPLLEGMRGKQGVNIDLFTDIILKVSQLTQILPEIAELDINPLIGQGDEITAVDLRIRIDANPQ